MRQVNKRFDAVVALKDASLNIRDGEIMALLGSNGSGKSTLVKVLAGVYMPNSGEILVDGKPETIRSGFDAQKLGIATAFQEMSLIQTMSVIDNMLLGKEPTKKFGIIDKSEAAHEVQAMLDKFHIKCGLDDYVNTLMPSTQYMLEVAKAVATKPKVLLLDEITAALHADEVETVFGILRELRSEGLSMIYVTHRMHEIFEICDRATIMRNGETMIEAKIEDLTLEDVVYHMTGARIESGKAVTNFASDFDPKGKELVLDAKDVKFFPKIKNISLQAHKGEIIGIGGLEGQGQSEFIRGILGTHEFESGSVVYLGKEVHFKSPYEAVNQDIGFVSGERAKEAIFPDRTIEENLYAGKAVRGPLFKFLPAKVVKSFSEEAVQKYRIKIGSLNHAANSLSGGNQQKLVIARWIASKPTLLLLDDPTKGIDVHSRAEIHKILKQCAEDGMTIVMSSSESEELLSVSDRVYVFFEGNVAAMLSGDTMTNENLAAAMMGVNSAAAEKGE